jgi:hypothetical protein
MTALINLEAKNKILTLYINFIGGNICVRIRFVTALRNLEFEKQNSYSWHIINFTGGNIRVRIVLSK